MLLNICRELELHDVVFVGDSVSAMIGVLAAAAEPDRFAKLVLVGPSAEDVPSSVELRWRPEVVVQAAASSLSHDGVTVLAV